jgi:hypothetical protein
MGASFAQVPVFENFDPSKPSLQWRFASQSASVWQDSPTLLRTVALALGAADAETTALAEVVGAAAVEEGATTDVVGASAVGVVLGS